MTRTSKLFIGLLLGASLAACGGSDDEPVVASATQTSHQPQATDTTQVAAGSTIVDVAQQQGFNALLAAATKADLATALSNPQSQLTVFAPTDVAFNRLATTLGFADANALVASLPADLLKSILTYHVLPARQQAADLQIGATSQATLYPFESKQAELKLNTQNGVRITDAALTTANVTTPDVSASNGVIHVIDKVLIPPGALNIVQMAQLNPDLASLVEAVTTANLQGTLSGSGPFTVFAPTNAAFSAAPAGLTKEQLASVLTYHVLGTQVLASDIPFDTPVNTLANQQITISKGTPPQITDTTTTRAQIIATDVRANNGVVHVIDKVLIPGL